MTSVYGFGAVKLEIVSAGVSCVIPAKRGYCSQPKFDPVKWEQKTANDKQLQKISGWWAKLVVFCENIFANDYLIFEDLVLLINVAASSGEAIRVYPKFVSGSAVNFYIDCLVSSGFEIADISNKREVGQRVPNLELTSQSKLLSVPFFTPAGVARIIGTSEGEGISTSDGKAITFVRW